MSNDQGGRDGVVVDGARISWLSSFNLKLDREVRDAFKKATRERHVSMQSVLSSFVDFYIENPDRIKLKMEVPRWVMKMEMD